MYFKTKCNKCDKSLKVSVEHVGRRARCPYCRHVTVIPKPSTEDEASSGDGGEFKFSSQANGGSLQGGTAAVSGDGGAGRSSTEANLLICLGVALLATALVCGSLIPFRGKHYLIDLIVDRGPIPYATVFLFFLAWAMLGMKLMILGRQRNSMMLDVLPSEIASSIGLSTLSRFIKHIDSLPSSAKDSILVNRTLRALEYFRVRKNTPEVASMIASQSEIDGNAMQSSFTMLNYCAWAIPILGFIGTVMGISEAVASFAVNVGDSAEMSTLKESINGVMGGLATAFDTTMLALVLSLIVMFAMNWMQKQEEDLLNWVDEYCNENLLKRLVDTDQAIDASDQNLRAIQSSINAALAPHHAEIHTWRNQLGEIGQKITRDVGAGWKSTHRSMQESQVNLVESLSSNAEKVAAVQSQQAETLERMAEAFASIDASLGKLDSVLAQRNGHGDADRPSNGGFVIEATTPKKKRGLFGLGR